MGAQASWEIQESVSKNKVFFEIEAQSAEVALDNNELPGSGLHQIVGNSPVPRRVLDMVRGMAPTRPHSVGQRGDRHGKRIGCEGDSQPASTPARTVRKNQLRCDPHQATRSPSSIPRKSQMYLRVRHMGFSK
jgi:hypothetical protein